MRSHSKARSISRYAGVFFAVTLAGIGVCTAGAVAGQTMADGTQQSASATSLPGDQESFVQKAHGDLKSWRQKIDEFGTRADASGRQDAKDAKKSLERAWSETETQGHKLETASASDWDDAKASYQRAVKDLSDRWTKLTQSDK